MGVYAHTHTQQSETERTEGRVFAEALSRPRDEVRASMLDKYLKNHMNFQIN